MSEQAVRQNVLQQFVERATSLYSLPAVAVQVLELTNRPTVDAAELKACVERDPALTGKLLRVVNSSMFGLSREVSDLNQALTMLGVKPLKLLVLGFSLPRKLYAGIEAETLQRFWQFTLLKAVTARELSEVFWHKAGDEAFIAGLLQEIGVLVLIQELGDSYVNFLTSVREQGADLTALEVATLGFDHAILSARLLDHWNLPEAIIGAVSAPHDMEQVLEMNEDASTLPQVLHLATLIASIIIDGRRAVISELHAAASRYRQITVEQIEAMLDQMQERVALMANVFSVRFDQQESYRDILSEAHQRMSEVAVEALPDMMASGSVYHEREALSDALEQFARGHVPDSRAVERSRESVAVKAVGPMVAGHEVDTADPGLDGRINGAMALCRSKHKDLSLIFLEIDDYANLLVLKGPDRLFQLVASMQHAIESLCDVSCESLLVSDSRYAIVLPLCDRRQAVELARSLIDRLPEWFLERGESDIAIQCSAGVASLAVPTRGSRPNDLTDAADRCLFAARASGGHVVKSIDVL